MRSLSSVVLLGIITLAGAQGGAPRPANDLLAEAQKQAKTEKKKVLLVFGASW